MRFHIIYLAAILAVGAVHAAPAEAQRTADAQAARVVPSHVTFATTLEYATEDTQSISSLATPLPSLQRVGVVGMDQKPPDVAATSLASHRSRGRNALIGAAIGGDHLADSYRDRHDK